MKYILSLLLIIGFCSFDKMDAPQYQTLVQAAQSEGKHMAIYFAGSDWCTNCVVFKKKHLEKDPIQQLLNSQYIFYTADFPQRKKLSKDEVKMNEALAEKLNPEGIFPLLVIADANLNIVAVVSSGTQPEEANAIIELHKSAK